jgi:predicted transcriptional regulator
MNTTLSLRVPTKTVEQLGQLAEATGKSRNFIAVQAMQDFIEREAWQVAEIMQALKEADAGEFATDEEVQAIKAKWSSNAY